MDNKNNNQSDFDIDVILEHARKLKLERLKHPEFSGPENQIRQDAGLKVMAETKAKPDNKKESDESDTKTFPVVKTQSDEIPAPELEDVKIYIPQPAEVAENNTEDIAAQAIEPENGLDAQSQVEHEQISLDSLMDEGQEAEQADDGEENWEEKLKRERRQKAESFKLQSPIGFRLSGEEEENDPGEEMESFEAEEIDDFISYEDTEAVKSELVYRRRTGWLQLGLTFLFTLVLTGANLIYNINESSLNPVLFIGINIFLLAFISLLNHRAIGEGFSALLKLNANADSVASLLVISTLIHSVIQFFSPNLLAGGNSNILIYFAANSLLFNSLGRQMALVRVGRNFQFVSYNSDKYTAKIIEDRKTACEIGRAAVAIGDPVVCYMEKTWFLSGFLKNSFEPDLSLGTMRIFIPCAAAASLALAILYIIFGGSLMEALNLFAASLCISLPIGVLSSVNFPLMRAAKKALRYGAMIVGWKAAEEFGDVHALAVDAHEVFPSESVLLHGIKTFSGARIDEAILDAAAVSIAAGGPLSSVFLRVIQNRTDILKEVDTLVYEQDMGLSGWVGGRRVLIGNRRLLENHGVDVPSRDYEARYTKGNRQVVYLSTSGELSAMFVLSYVPDESIAKALKRMCSAGITLLVRTCDPNITEELICQTYGLDSYYVEVMTAPAGRSYEKLADVSSESDEAVLASNGRLDGTATGVTYCRRLLKAIRLALIIQVIGGALGLSMAFFVALYKGLTLPPLFILLYSVAWTVLSWVFPAAYKV